MDEYLTLGFFDFQFKVDEAVITDLQIFTDCLYPGLVDDVLHGLRGKKFAAITVQNLFSQLKIKYADLENSLDELQKWLCTQIEI
jgi:lipoate-protein ligase A